MLEKIKKELKLQSIEGKQKLIGLDTGTEWEVDAKGVSEESEGIVLIECRRYTASRQNQERVAALAYRIHDTRARGGIMVTPLGLQSGAKRVAEANNIKSVEIDANSTPENFAMRFLKQLFGGVTDKIGLSDAVDAVVIKKCKACGSSFKQINDEVLCANCNA